MHACSQDNTCRGRGCGLAIPISVRTHGDAAAADDDDDDVKAKMMRIRRQSAAAAAAAGYFRRTQQPTALNVLSLGLYCSTVRHESYIHVACHTVYAKTCGTGPIYKTSNGAYGANCTVGATQLN